MDSRRRGAYGRDGAQTCGEARGSSGGVVRLRSGGSDKAARGFRGEASRLLSMRICGVVGACGSVVWWVDPAAVAAGSKGAACCTFRWTLQARMDSVGPSRFLDLFLYFLGLMEVDTTLIADEKITSENQICPPSKIIFAVVNFRT